MKRELSIFNTRKRTSPSRDERGSASDSILSGVKDKPLASRTGNWLPALVLIAATLIAYQPVWHAGFIWDDDAYVTANTNLRSWAGLGQIWAGAMQQYYPLVHTSFWLEYHLWGLHPLGYHLVNVLLHASASWLLWRALAGLQIPFAGIAAFIFALHPVAVESVAWVTERKNVLSAAFYFAAALAYLRFNEFRDSGNGNGWRWYAGACFLYLAALLSKTVTCSLPAALLLICWWRTGRLRRKDVSPLVPFFILGAGLGMVTVWMENHHVGAQGPTWSLGFVERILVAGRAFWFYAGKLLWPARLAFAYPHWQVSAAAWWQWLFPATVLGLVVGLWLARRRIGRGPLAAVLFFGGTLVPALGFFNVYPMRFSFVADHFQYLAGAGVLVLCAAALSRLPRSVVAVLVVTLGTLTWRQCGMYRDLETLWRTTIARYPDSYLAQGNLGGRLLEKGETDEAIVHLQKALELEPDSLEANYDLGNAYLKTGRFDQAIVRFQKTLQLAPRFADANYNLGNAFLQSGQPEPAAVYYARALAIQPDDVMACNNLGLALILRGRFDAAIDCLQRGLAIHPEDVRLLDNLGNALLQKDQVAEAITQFQKALTLQPDFRAAAVDLDHVAWRLATSPDPSRRNGAKAVELAEQVERLTGAEDPRCLATMAAAYAETGQFSRALSVAQSALHLATDKHDSTLASAIEAHIKSYQSGTPIRDAGK